MDTRLALVAPLLVGSQIPACSAYARRAKRLPAAPPTGSPTSLVRERLRKVALAHARRRPS